MTIISNSRKHLILHCRGEDAGGKGAGSRGEQSNQQQIAHSPDRRPSIAKNLVDIDRLIGASLSDYVRVNATCPVLLARTIG